MIRLVLAFLVTYTICTEAFEESEDATVPGDRAYRAAWGGPSDDPKYARGYRDGKLSEVKLGVFADSDVVDGLDP